MAEPAPATEAELEALRPAMPEPENLAMNDRWVVERMAQELAARFNSLLVAHALAGGEPQLLGPDALVEAAGALLALRGTDGRSKLLWTRRDLYEVFRRQQSSLAPQPRGLAR